MRNAWNHQCGKEMSWFTRALACQDEARDPAATAALLWTSRSAPGVYPQNHSLATGLLLQCLGSPILDWRFRVQALELGVRIVAVAALIGLYAWNPLTGMAGLTIVFSYVVAQRRCAS